jgi:hypothetical protein
MLTSMTRSLALCGRVAHAMFRRTYAIRKVTLTSLEDDQSPVDKLQPLENQSVCRPGRQRAVRLTLTDQAVPPGLSDG